MMVSEKHCYFRDCARGNYSCVTHLSLLSDFCPQYFPWISSVTQFIFFYFVYTSVHVLLIEGKYVMGKVMEQKAFTSFDYPHHTAGNCFHFKASF